MVSVVNYGMGNIRSVQSALDFLKVPNRIVEKDEEIIKSEKIILPGVGSFRKAIENINRMNIFDSLIYAGNEKKIPILGICLGMQLLASSSEEEGFTEGLGFITHKITKFEFDNNALKIPHIGFNTVQNIDSKSLLFKGLHDTFDFYFVHSFKMADHHADYITGRTFYGEMFASAVEKDNIFGTQFHPEKSQSNGLKVLKNFCSL